MTQAPARDPSELAATRELIDRLFVAMRTVASHDAEHPLAVQAADAVSLAVDLAKPPVQLQFVAGGVFRDRVMLPLEVEIYVRAAQVGAALEALDAHELVLERSLGRTDALHLAHVLARGALGRSVDAGAVPPGVRLRSVADAVERPESAAIAPDLAGVAQVSLAVAEAERLVAASTGPWPWDRGMAVVRRVEAAIANDPAAAARAVELGAGSWTPARQAVAAAQLVLSTLLHLGTSRQTTRAAAHAALGIAAQGLHDRGGLPARDAADALIPRMGAGRQESLGAAAAHGLQTLAIVHQLSSAGAAHITRLRVARAVELAYELERVRRPDAIDLTLTRADLLAQAASRAGADVDEAWLGVAVAAGGPFPPGSCIETAAGELGVLLGASREDDPSRMHVLLHGAPRELTEPLHLVPPHRRVLRGGAG